MSVPDFTLFDTIEQAIFVLTEDSSGKITYAFANRYMRERLQRPLGDIVGMTARELYDGRASENVYRRHTQAWASGVVAFHEVAVPVAGETVWVRTNLTPIHDDSGRMTHMVGFAHDVTKHKELEQAQTMASAMAGEMEDFVSLAAHDLRSPMANVRMLTDLLREGFVDMGDGKLEMIEMIEKISERALMLVSDVLSQAVATRAQISNRIFNFEDLCDDVLVTLDPSRHHHVFVSPIHVEGDYTAIQIILRNLIDNAFKHAGPNQIEITIDMEAQDDKTLLLTVCDDGKGFEDPALAFLDGGALSNQSGFGLLGVRRLVRSRGGTISAVAPTSGRGAEIRVTLPGYTLDGNTASKLLASA